MLKDTSGRVSAERERVWERSEHLPVCWFFFPHRIGTGRCVVHGEFDSTELANGGQNYAEFCVDLAVSHLFILHAVCSALGGLWWNSSARAFSI